MRSSLVLDRPAACRPLSCRACGLSVVLVEAKRFPRYKVCGGCLNRRAWNVLESVGLASQIDKLGTQTLNRIQLVCGAVEAEWAMPAMHAISRFAMDQFLFDHASQLGVMTVPECMARVQPCSSNDTVRRVELKHKQDGERVVEAKVVLAADGLTHSSLAAMEHLVSEPAPDSHIGLGALLQMDASTTNFPADRLTMVVGREGYVGITQVEETGSLSHDSSCDVSSTPSQRQLNVAAAVSAASLRRSGSPGLVIQKILEDNQVAAPPGILDADWTGTPALTRESRRWADHRLFLIGDAAGYVEPFTGEGMSWALAGAAAVVDYAHRATVDWSPELATQWHARWRQYVRQHQRTCRGLSWLLRHPRLSSMVLRSVRYAPWIAEWTMQRAAGRYSGAPRELAFGK